MRIIYSPEASDDEWRASNFSSLEIITAQSIPGDQPTAAELIKAAERFGTDGILETAIMLPQSQFRKVHAAVDHINGARKRRKHAIT